MANEYKVNITNLLHGDCAVGSSSSSSGSSTGGGGTGAQGPQGPQGVPGSDGIIGVDGEQGNQGYQGAGFQGHQGDQGDQGVAGSSEIPFVVTVSSGKFFIDGSAPAFLRVLPNFRYKFDLSDSSNATHVFTLSETEDGIHNQGSTYLTGVTKVGTEGSAGAYLLWDIPNVVNDEMYYFCTLHSNMGGIIKTTGADGHQGQLGHQGIGEIGAQGHQGVEGVYAGIGYQGHTGGDGVEGHQGYQGYGHQGFQGHQGDLGFQGVKGDDGDDGDDGDTGATGNQGHQGFQGTKGDDGGDGDTGATGNQGHQGDGHQGHQGLHGSWGALGYQGWQGVQGHQGYGHQGHQGVDGAWGAFGYQGNDGSDGGITFQYGFSVSTSAWTTSSGAPNIALNESIQNTSTIIYIDHIDADTNNISSFLETIDDSTSSVKGHVQISEKDDNSQYILAEIIDSNYNSGWSDITISVVASSADSPFSATSEVLVTFARTGDRGETGLQGVQGHQGYQGFQGSIGDTGDTGDQGTPGVTGFQGHQGNQGHQGDLGFQGHQGAGHQGFQGEKGDAGQDGSYGAIGYQGNYGCPGCITSPYQFTTPLDDGTWHPHRALTFVDGNGATLTADAGQAIHLMGNVEDCWSAGDVACISWQLPTSAPFYYSGNVSNDGWIRMETTVQGIATAGTSGHSNASVIFHDVPKQLASISATSDWFLAPEIEGNPIYICHGPCASIGYQGHQGNQGNLGFQGEKGTTASQGCPSCFELNWAQTVGDTEPTTTTAAPRIARSIMPWDDPHSSHNHECDISVCGATEHVKHCIEQDPEFLEKYKQQEEEARKRIESGSYHEGGTRYVIPLWFNIVGDTQGVVTDAIMQEQVAKLNEDFRKTNTDITSRWENVQADTWIEFVWDTNNKTIGTGIYNGTQITSWPYYDSSNPNSEYYNANSVWGGCNCHPVKSALHGGADVTSPTTFLNVWIANLSGGLLGWAQFPGGPSSIDGVVISTSSLPTIGSSPYNLGRTAVHEVGHYLNLRHIWGDGDCNVDDSVTDTPVAADPNFGCPNISKDSCPNHADPDMWENYMDYTNDSCMTMFTKGQRTRMLDTLQNIRTGIWTGYSCPTCVDPTATTTTSAAGVTTTAAPPSGLSVTGAASCMQVGDTYCLSFVDSSCNKKIIGEVEIGNVILGSTDESSWITVIPICSSSLLDDLANGDEVTLCKGTCAVAGGDTFVAEVDPTCAGNGDSWIKVNSSGNVINFYKKANNSWSEQDLTDPCPTISFAAATSSIVEGNVGQSTHTITVNRSTSLGTSSVDFATSDGSAQEGIDYTSPTPPPANVNTVTWAPGETSKDISILVGGDTTIESNETFNVTLLNPIHLGSSATITGTNPHVVTITNDDVVTFSFASGTSTVTEGNSGTSTHSVTVNRAIPNNTVTSSVDYLTSDGTAVANTDYTPAAGTLAFAAGETSKTIDITITGEIGIEGDETFNVTLSNALSSVGVPTITAPTTHVVTIVDDDEIDVNFALDLSYLDAAALNGTTITPSFTPSGHVNYNHFHWGWTQPPAINQSATGWGTMVPNGTSNFVVSGATVGTHTLYVASVDANHFVTGWVGMETIISPTRFVEGIVADWHQPPFYESGAGQSVIASGDVTGDTQVQNGIAWCSPTAAACQLSHLNSQYALINPDKPSGHLHGINDNLDAGSLDASQHGLPGVGTKDWNSGEHGWGDYLIDRPNAAGGPRYPMGFMSGNYDYNGTQIGQCELNDFGWFMNTNLSSENQLTDPRITMNSTVTNGDGIIDIPTSWAGIGSTIGNIYKGLKDFYRTAGYANLADDISQPMVGIVYHRSDGAGGFTQPQGRLPRHWINTLGAGTYALDSGVIDHASQSTIDFTWEMIKQEIDENRTVIACMQGWDLNPGGGTTYTLPAGFPNTIHPLEKLNTGGVPNGADYYDIGPSNPSGIGFDGTPYTMADETDGVSSANHWGGNALGHTVLIVGYIPAGGAADVSDNNDTKWLIVRDNHDATERNVIIPYDSVDKNITNGNNVQTIRWASEILMATLYVNLFDDNGAPLPYTAGSCSSPKISNDENIDDQTSFGYN